MCVPKISEAYSPPTRKMPGIAVLMPSIFPLATGSLRHLWCNMYHKFYLVYSDRQIFLADSAQNIIMKYAWYSVLARVMYPYVRTLTIISSIFAAH